MSSLLTFGEHDHRASVITLSRKFTRQRFLGFVGAGVALLNMPGCKEDRQSHHSPPARPSEVTPLLTGDPLPNNWRKSSAAAAQSSEEWGRPWMKALRTNNYLYVEYKTGEYELYDLRKDPYELHNMYATATAELKQRLEAQLDALRRCSAEECRAAEDS